MHFIEYWRVMFTIRGNQLSQLEEATRQCLGERLASFLQASFDDAAELPTSALIPVVRQLIPQALSYGLVSESQVATLVICAWLLGADFATRFPAASAVLTDVARAPETKARWLEGWVQTLFESLDEQSEAMG